MNFFIYINYKHVGKNRIELGGLEGKNVLLKVYIGMSLPIIFSHQEPFSVIDCSPITRLFTLFVPICIILTILLRIKLELNTENLKMLSSIQKSSFFNLYNIFMLTVFYFKIFLTIIILKKRHSMISTFFIVYRHVGKIVL